MHRTETYGSVARHLRPQIKDGVVLEYIHFHHFSAVPRALIFRERVPKRNTGK